MAATYSQQYRPITGGASGETADGDGLSVRAFRDLRRNDNALKNAAPRSMVYQNWTNFLTVVGAAEQTVGNWRTPAWAGFPNLRFKVWGRLQGGGSSSVVRLYTDRTLAAGFSTVTSAALSAAVSVNSTSNAWYESGPLAIVRGPDIYPPMTSLILSVDNANDGTVLLLGTVSIWLEPLT